MYILFDQSRHPASAISFFALPLSLYKGVVFSDVLLLRKLGARNPLGNQNSFHLGVVSLQKVNSVNDGGKSYWIMV